MEHSPQPERLTDEELIDREITASEDQHRTITDAAARMIASQIHGGQTSSMYGFASSGYVDKQLMRELKREHNSVDKEHDPAQKRRLQKLSHYLWQRIQSETDNMVIEDWPKLWLRQPEDDLDPLCPCCAEHISKPHRVGCPLAVDDEAQLNRVQALQAEHGNPILFWLDYVGFRNADELEQVAAQFSDNYYGFYPDLDTFRQSYEMPADAYLDQSYHMVWDDGGIYIYDR